MKVKTTDGSTEEKIREAARRVFVSKGFDGCSSRDIAAEAGMNVALVNYYFRSKAQLFQLVFEAALEEMLMALMEVFSSDLSLEQKVRVFIEREYEFLTKHSELPGFIMTEMRREDGCSVVKRDLLLRLEESGIIAELHAAQESGQVRKIDLLSIMLLMMGNCDFPFMSSGMMKALHNISDEEYTDRLRLHKQYVTEMLIGYLFLDK